jgi:uncharacterized protein GlcG (DUF336 family)
MADPLLIHTRLMSLDLARDIAWKAIEACRESGYSVSAVVVDRSGDPLVVMRDVYASRFTVDIARDKANAVILSGVSSAEFARNRADIRDEMNLVDGIMVLDGGLPVTSAGTLLGAIGISGSPGGDKDEACARNALDAVQERLEFAE